MIPILVYFCIIEKWGGIDEFLVNIYILRTKKLYSDPDFHTFYHGGTGWNLRVHECLENIYKPRTEKLWPDPDFHIFVLSSRNGVEFASFL